MLPAQEKLLEKIVFDQIQCYFAVNKLTTNFQHAYRERHSTCTALTQITDDWLKENDNKIVDFSAAFDFIDHNLLLRKRMSFQPLPHRGFKAIYITELSGLSLMEASLMATTKGMVYRREAL